MLPDFIGIGPARSATTWIYECLNDHPQICMARWDKKTHFFDLYYDRGIQWYETLFSHCPEGLKKGELTETYIFYDEVPQRIHKHCPSVKIFACLRNPIDRAFSAYHHLIRDGAITADFEDAIVQLRKILITDSFYYDHFKPYFNLFPEEQIYVSIFEDVAKNPAAFLQKLYAFLEVDDRFLPQNYDQRRNVTAYPRFRLLNKMMLITHFYLRDLDLFKYLTPLRNSKIIQRLRFKEPAESAPTMCLETRKKLQDEFGMQIEKLGKLIGRDLSHWS